MNRRRIFVGVLMFSLLLTQAAGPSSLSEPSLPNPSADRYEDLVIGVPHDRIGPWDNWHRPGSVVTLYGGPSPGLSGGSGLRTQPTLLPDDSDYDGDEFGKALATGDFDGDGWYDLAVGVPHEDLWSISNCGAVTVYYSSAAVPPRGTQLWYQNLTTEAQAGDEFGRALAAGDFDGDGYDDLAVGVPEEDIGGKGGAGQVDVYYGTVSGLSSSRHQEWDQDNLGVNYGAGSLDNFGWALATGDFDDDGYDDLAVGVPEDDSLVETDIGVVNIIYGTASGLSATGKQQWHQDAGTIISGADAGDQFGKALATGDFDRDGYADLAVGVPYEDKGTTSGAGAVNVIYGSSSGLTDDGNQFFQQKIGDSDNAEQDDRLGWALASGDFDGDRFDDLAIGTHYEDVGSEINAGAVSVVYGAASGLYSKYNRWFHQDYLDPTDTAEAGDWFGFALAAGDWDGNGCDDLAIGVPFEHIGSWPDDNGLVNVVFGSTSGLSPLTIDDQQWWQSTGSASGEAREDDHFGWALASRPNRTYSAYLALILRDAP